MIAYKFLETGAGGPFSGFRLPGPGVWVEAAPPVELCRNGIHACSREALPEWLADELWEVELAGNILEHDGVLVAQRGRLVEHIQEWNAKAAHDFAVSCAARLGERTQRDERLRPFSDDAEALLERADDPKLAAVVAYIGRHAEKESEHGGWQAERASQAQMIRERAGL